MTKLTLHIDAEPGMDAEAVAKALEARCAQLAEFEMARAKVSDERVIGVDDIILVLTVSSSLLTTGALTLESLRRFIAAAKGVAEEFGLRNATIEGRGRLVPFDQVNEADAQAIAART
jgi:hypothetical protein